MTDRPSVTPDFPRCRIRVLASLAGLWALAAATVASAVPFNLTVFADRASGFDASFSWAYNDFIAATDQSGGPFTGNGCVGDAIHDGKNFPDRKCWTVKSLSSAKAAAGKNRDLSVEVQHFPGEVLAHLGPPPPHGPNGTGAVLEFKDIAQPSTRGAAARVAHDEHSDYFFGKITAFRPALKASPTIDVSGRHETAPLNLVRPSFRNFLNGPVTGEFLPSYHTNPFSPFPQVVSPQQNKQPFNLKKGEATTGNAFRQQCFDIDGNPVADNDPKCLFKMDPSDYTVRVSGSATTETTLAFLGTSEGVSGVTELELAPLIDMAVGTDTFLVPSLREESGLTPLFVFVDLTQWLAAGISFDPLENFDLLAGLSDSLPGFFVSTSPISLNQDGSFLGAPYSGTLIAAGAIDGGLVPLPGTLLLLLAASVALPVLRRKAAARSAG